MKKIVKLSVLVIIGLFSFTLLSPATTFAAGSTGYADVCSQDVPQGVKDAAGCPGNSNSDLPTVIQNILNAIIAVAGIVSVVFIIIGGIQYTTSAGDPGKTKKAKDTILYALIGLIICALSFAIVNFTISRIIYNNNSSSEDDQSAYEDASSTWISSNHQ